MKVINHTKDAVTIELTPMELDLFNKAMTKEGSHRRKTWKQVKPQFLEEMLYHHTMHDMAEQMKIESSKLIRTHERRWGVLR